MGTIVRGQCDCGFDTTFYLGGGLTEAEDRFLFGCQNCCALVIRDMREESASLCVRCSGLLLSYSDMRMSAPGSGRHEVFSWNAPSAPPDYEECLAEFGQELIDDVIGGEEKMRADLEAERRAYDALNKARLCVLHDGRYRCPECRQMSMRFEFSGLWD